MNDTQAKEAIGHTDALTAGVDEWLDALFSFNALTMKDNLMKQVYMHASTLPSFWGLKAEHGQNDKQFFVHHFEGEKLFVAKNETGGYTVMFPKEY